MQVNPKETFRSKPKLNRHLWNSHSRGGFARRQLLYCLLVLIAGAIIAVIFIVFKKRPERVVSEKLAPLVEVYKVGLKDVPMVIKGTGTVKAKVEVDIVPQVSGKIDLVNPSFRAGGVIEAGQEIIRIDPRDYELAVRQTKSAVADAMVKYDMEQAEAQVALQQWHQLHPDSEPNSPLVLRKPQIRQAEAQVQSAKARLSKTLLDLERTTLSLPIAVRIVKETVDLGQFVSAGQSIGKGYGTKVMEIEVPLEDAKLAWFDIPNRIDSFDNDESGSKKTEVEIQAKFAGELRSWTGYVKRTTGQVDMKSRMVTVVIEVPAPFEKAGGKVPLIPGMFVEVAIKGNVLKDAALIPRDAVREGNNVWIVNGNQLHIQSLKIERTDKDFAYVTDGIKNGDLIVTSSLDVVIDGMKVRAQEASKPEEQIDFQTGREQ